MQKSLPKVSLSEIFSGHSTVQPWKYNIGNMPGKTQYWPNNVGCLQYTKIKNKRKNQEAQGTKNMRQQTKGAK